MAIQPPRPGRLLRATFLTQWLILCLGIALVGGYVGYTLYDERMATDARERNRLLTQARVINENLAQQIAATDAALRNIIADLDGWRGPTGWSPDAPGRLRALERVMPGIRTFAVADADGIVKLSSRDELLNADVRGRQYFRTAAEHPNPSRLYVSPPFVTRLNVFAMTISRALTRADGSFAGLVIATLDPQYFRTLLKSVIYAPDMWTALAHGDGTQFVLIPEREGQSGKNLAQPGSFFFRHIASGQSENVQTGTVFATGEERMMATITVRPATLPMDSPLVVGVSRDLDTITASWRRTARNEGGGVALVALLSIVALATYQRRQYLNLRQIETAEEELRQHRRDLQAILDGLPSPISYWDRALRNRFGNHAYRQWLGVDPERMRGRHIREVIGEDLYRAAQPHIEGVLNGEAQVFEHIIPTPDGKDRRHALVHFVPDFRHGETVGFYALVSDITSIRDTETALQDSEARYRLLFNNCSDVITVHGADSAAAGAPEHFIEVNDVACRRLGYSRDELLALTPADIAGDRTDTIAALRQGGGTATSRRTLLAKDGRDIPVEISAHLLDVQGMTVVLSIARDLSGYRTIEAESGK